MFLLVSSCYAREIARSRIATVIQSCCLSVLTLTRFGTVPSPGKIKTLGFYRIIAKCF